jgi:hypothetical protein
MSEPAITYTDLAIAFCKVFEVSEYDLNRKGCKHMPLVRIRWALWSALMDAGYSVTDIGRRCNRDHSTVSHAMDRYAVIVHDRGFLALVEAAKSLAPEIASHRAAGGRIDLVAVRQHVAQERLRMRKCEAPGYDPELDEDDWEHRMRSHCMSATEAFGEALRQEVEA